MQYTKYNSTLNNCLFEIERFAVFCFGEVRRMGHWEVFLGPYKQAVDELKIKLKGMRWS